MSIKRIALFASGSGTNAQNIIEYFAGNQEIVVDCLLSNNAGAYALVRARNFGIETLVFSKETFYQTSLVPGYLTNRGINLVVLAGFLLLVPGNILDRFTVMNIHPALLPSYGGKNMYGNHVHRAVIANNEPFSGITIHYVNEKYDEGAILFQARCPVYAGDTPESLAERIHLLEYRHYPSVIEEVVRKL
jgi:phosphoribosylglycinamide formyltransferase-1